MSVTAVSPVLVGRGVELGELDAAFAEVRAGLPRVVLVGGEAGVGKTRLVREFGGKAATAGAKVLVGGCLELGVDGFPFAPFTAILRQLVREIGQDGVAELLSGRVSGLGRLLPEFGEADAHDATGQARLFELLLTLFDRMAARGPVVLLIEDAHWADRSSRDLLAFLVRNLGAVAALMIVVTYRSDELHRAHPLRPMLAELDRIDRVSRHEVDRLSRREVGELMERLRGVAPDVEQVEKFYARSEGNPLFVEALMEADGEIAHELPESLRDLLLAGVQRLPEETQELLRVASAGLSRIDHRLLAAVMGSDEVSLTRGLRPAVAGNILVVDGDGYAFRHALIREAIHDDLLPGEHTRLHTRFAEALEQDSSLVPPGRAAAELAHHWHAAHNLEWALISAERAAQEALKAAAYAEELRMLERVLELWESVPDAAGKIGRTHDEILESAVCAADLTGDSARGIKLATAALKEIDDQARRAGLLERRGRMMHRIGQHGWIDDLREAIRIIPAEPSVARARALSAFGQYLFMGFGSKEADVAAREALVIAREVGDHLAEAGALLTLACLEGSEAYETQHSEFLEQANRLAEEQGFEQIELRCAVNQTHFLEGSGRNAEAIELAGRAIQKAREYGLYRIHGSFIAINHGESLFTYGRWDEALAAMEQALETDPPLAHETCLLQLSGEIRAARGEHDEAWAKTRAALATGVWEIDQRLQEYLPIIRTEAELLLAEGRATEALEHLSPILAESDRPDGPRYTWPALIVAARAATSPDELAPFLKKAAELGVFGPLQRAWKLTFDAEAGRVTGKTPDWPAAIAAWEGLVHPYSLAKALLSAARYEASHGDKERATVKLARVVKIAGELGAAPLRNEAMDLKQRIGTGVRSSPSHGLTARELEVLKYLSLGHSNKEIAEALFISAKTASVHVSNILGKLGAATRTEAAATARRLGLQAD